MFERKKNLKLSTILLTTSILFLSCAKTVTKIPVDKTILFSFKVKGKLILNNPNITYYVVFNAPAVDPKINTSINVDVGQGPRINGADITKGNSLPEGRIPFIGKQPSDLDSTWTDFFYITNSGGNPVIGRGSTNYSNIVYDRNYQNNNTKALDQSSLPMLPNDTTKIAKGYQIEFPLKSLNNGQALKLNNMTCNIAVSGNIETGYGHVYDNWTGNTPFSIPLIKSIVGPIIKNQPPSMKKILGIPDTILPDGVGLDDVTISEYSITITE